MLLYFFGLSEMLNQDLYDYNILNINAKKLSHV